MRIGNKEIGKGKPVFVIAEAGVNHNGKIEIAKKLVDAAKDAGADAIKFQTFKTEDLVTEKTDMASYQKENLNKEESQKAMLKKLELDYEVFKELKKYCDEKEIIFLSTAHTADAVDFLDPLMDAFKLGSGDLTNIPVIKKIASKRKPMILGTGMATIEEVKEAAETIKSENNDQIVLLHCTTNYPCPREDVNLRAIKTIEKETNCLTGYSDHTLGIDVPLMAAKLGAVMIEKHFTLNKNMEGPDHKASLNPEELKELIEKLKNKKYPELDNVVLGSEEKKPTEAEKEISKVIRKSIVSLKDIKKGTKVSREMLIIKRPGTGIKPKEIYKIVGKFAIRDIKKDELISWSDVK
jgi:N,N'-diacetyllegionaminate synthase